MFNPKSFCNSLWVMSGEKIQFPLQKWSKGCHASENKARAEPPSVQKLDMGKILADNFLSGLEGITEERGRIKIRR